MDTKITVALAAPRSRRRHSPEFKAQVIAACQQPGVSIAAVAQANGLNANFLRQWLKAYREGQLQSVRTTHAANLPASTTAPTLVPVTVAVAGDIQIEIRREQTVFQITWPASQAASCAQWLREIMK